jgi:hypothetical protein
MKIITALSLSLFVLISVPFMAGGTAGSASGQVVTTTKKVSHKTKVGTKKVGRKSWRGTKRVAHTSRVKSQPVRRKTWRTGRKVVSRTKKILS